MTLEDIKKNGIVGAGGAGFPSHIKINSSPEIIIMNAAEAMGESGTLTLKTSLNSKGKYIKIDFIDTGHGILEKDMKQLFEPFFTTKEVGKGTGLGLAISYSIIQKHDGTIDVKSRPGEGATFTVRLPIKREINNE